jgi:hypothetical protein
MSTSCGQLVDLRRAQQAAEAEHARVAGPRDHAGVRALLDVHGPELVHREGHAVEADARRAVEDRARAEQADAERGQQQQRRGRDEQQARHEHVEDALGHRGRPIQAIPAAASVCPPPRLRCARR